MDKHVLEFENNFTVAYSIQINESDLEQTLYLKFILTCE